MQQHDKVHVNVGAPTSPWASPWAVYGKGELSLDLGVTFFTVASKRGYALIEQYVHRNAHY